MVVNGALPYGSGAISRAGRAQRPRPHGARVTVGPAQPLAHDETPDMVRG